jgi:hypothetical protein
MHTSRASNFLYIAESMTCCPCYNPDSFDARCCGVCFYYCPNKNKDSQVNICPFNCKDYWFSGYIQTTDECGPDLCGPQAYGLDAYEPNPYGVNICCVVCFPLKFALFLPCGLGTVFNHCINCMRGTELNYLL